MVVVKRSPTLGRKRSKRHRTGLAVALFQFLGPVGSCVSIDVFAESVLVRTAGCRNAAFDGHGFIDAIAHHESDRISTPRHQLVQQGEYLTAGSSASVSGQTHLAGKGRELIGIEREEILILRQFRIVGQMTWEGICRITSRTLLYHVIVGAFFQPGMVLHRVAGKPCDFQRTGRDVLISHR